MVTSLTETRHAAGFMVSEAPGTRSRDVGTVISGASLLAGAVLGRITKGSAAAVAGTNTGNGTMGAITVGAAAVPGVYTLRINVAATNAGTFQVTDPDGDVVGIGVVATAFAGGGLSFTLADGATDFAVGDTFAITVAAGSGKYNAYDPTATNGLEDAVAILWDDVDASAADKVGTIVTRDAEVNWAELVWGAAVTTDGHKTTARAALALLGIIGR